MDDYICTLHYIYTPQNGKCCVIATENYANNFPTAGYNRNKYLLFTLKIIKE